MNSYLSAQELRDLGLSSCGKKVLISRKASIYGADRIQLGSHVRIDDFCIVSAGEEGIFLGNYVHIAAYSLLVGKERIEMKDFSGASSRVCVYSSSDDYSGNAMTNPTVPTNYTSVKHAPVVIGRHAIIGAGAILLPGVTLQDGVAIGALALVTRDCMEFGIYAGVPARRTAERSRRVLELEDRLMAEENE